VEPGADRCVTCSADLIGDYCHSCGEKRRDPGDLTLSSFAHYALEAVTNADAKLYATLRLLVARPGELTREFMAGRRRPYVAPLQLFLVCNLLFFFLISLGYGPQAFTTDLVHHRTQLGYGPVADAMIEDRIGVLPPRPVTVSMQEWLRHWPEAQAEFRDRFNEASPRYANSLIIIMVPLFAVLIRLLRLRTIFVRELTFSLHFFSFLLLWLLAMPLIMLAMFLVYPPAAAAFDSEAVAALLIVAVCGGYLTLAYRRVHSDAWPAALLRAAASMAFLLAVVTVHRAILFFVVFRAV
jgi:hypothetical protein